MGLLGCFWRVTLLFSIIGLGSFRNRAFFPAPRSGAVLKAIEIREFGRLCHPDLILGMEELAGLVEIEVSSLFAARIRL